MPADMHRLENAARIAMGHFDHPAFEAVAHRAPSRLPTHMFQAAGAALLVTVFAGFLF